MRETSGADLWVRRRSLSSFFSSWQLSLRSMSRWANSTLEMWADTPTMSGLHSSFTVRHLHTPDTPVVYTPSPSLLPTPQLTSINIHSTLACHSRYHTRSATPLVACYRVYPVPAVADRCVHDTAPVYLAHNVQLTTDHWPLTADRRPCTPSSADSYKTTSAVNITFHPRSQDRQRHELGTVCYQRQQPPSQLAAASVVTYYHLIIILLSSYCLIIICCDCLLSTDCKWLWHVWHSF